MSRIWKEANSITVTLLLPFSTKIHLTHIKGRVWSKWLLSCCVKRDCARRTRWQTNEGYRDTQSNGRSFYSTYTHMYTCTLFFSFHFTGTDVWVTRGFHSMHLSTHIHTNTFPFRSHRWVFRKQYCRTQMCKIKRIEKNIGEANGGIRGVHSESTNHPVT